MIDTGHTGNHNRQPPLVVNRLFRQPWGMGRKSKSDLPRPAWAARITAARAARGISQDGLANELNIGQSSVSSWERGEYAPSPHMLKKLAVALAVPVTEILPPALQQLAQEQADFDAGEPPEDAFGSFAAAFLRAVQQITGGKAAVSTVLAQARRVWRFAGGTDDTAADLDRLSAGMEMTLDTYRAMASRPGRDTKETG